MASVREREDKYDVPVGFAVPDLSGVIPSQGSVHTRVARLTSTYFDTGDLALLAAGVVLRHRAGDEDVGWQLKVPIGDGDRAEIRVDEAADHRAASDRLAALAVPEELERLLVGIIRRASLHEVARVDTERTVYALETPYGDVLAEIADDTVRATGTGASATAVAWREVEVELKSDAEYLRGEVGQVLEEGGARLSESSSKLSRVLADERHRLARTETEFGPAASAVLRYLADQHRQVLLGDIGLRHGNPTVHDTRVAMRRIRSTLRTFSPLWQAEAAGRLDRELKWIAGVLGDVRDLEVLRKRFAEALHHIPESLVLGPVAGRIEQDLLREQLAAEREMKQALSSDRYLGLLDDLDRWIVDPPLQSSAGGADLSDLANLAGSVDRKAKKRLRKGLHHADPNALHRARKAAKRARYAYDVLRPYDKPSRQYSKRMKALQTILGAHQDSVVAREQLRRMAVSIAGQRDESGFTYGLLYGREERAAATAVAAARRW